MHLIPESLLILFAGYQTCIIFGLGWQDGSSKVSGILRFDPHGQGALKAFILNKCGSRRLRNLFSQYFGRIVFTVMPKLQAEADLRVAQAEFDKQAEITKLLLEGIQTAHVGFFFFIYWSTSELWILIVIMVAYCEPSSLLHRNIVQWKKKVSTWL